uniref:Epithelial sodium channel/degenerin-like protein n=1 Tax=Polyphagotarsonemus latus TaxID=1204166 RepID=A0AAN0N818_9ACAR
MTKSNFLKHFLIFFTCFYACFYQLRLLIDNYLSYEIETEVTTNYAEEKVIIPDISLCNFFIDLLDEDKLRKSSFKNYLFKNKLMKDNQLIKDLLRNEKIFQLFENFYTINQISYFFYEPKQIFRKIKSLVYNDTFIGLVEKECEFKFYSSLQDACYLIICPYQKKETKTYSNIYVKKNILSKSKNKNIFLQLNLNQDTLKKIFSPFAVYILSTNIGFPYRSSTKTSISLMSPDIPRKYIITYQRYRSRLLPAPYKTDCVDYQLQGHISRSQKIDKCIKIEKNAFEELRNRSYFGNLVYGNETNQYFDFYRQFFNSKEYKKLFPVLSFVYDKCANQSIKKDCYAQNFTPFLVQQLIIPNNSKTTVLKLLATTLPQIKNKTKPKLNPNNFFALACSIVSFWFGITIFRFIYFASDFYSSCKTKILKLKVKKQISKPTKTSLYSLHKTNLYIDKVKNFKRLKLSDKKKIELSNGTFEKK